MTIVNCAPLTCWNKMRRQVLGAAGVDRPEIELARRLARRLDDVLHRLVGRGRRNRQQDREARGNGNLRKVVEHVVRQVLEQAHADRLPVPHFAERVAVGRRAQHRPHGRDAAGAGPVLDDERPA